MGISRDSLHKRRHTGGKRKINVKKNKYNLGRQAANTSLGEKRVRPVRCMGGNMKFRALRLDGGNFSLGSEVCTRKSRILDVVYNASNNELVRTKTLVKGCIVQVDATPFKQWYEQHYGVELVKRRAGNTEEKPKDEVKTSHVARKHASRRKEHSIDELISEGLVNGRLLASISSRPGQCGRADGYILEGSELRFYLKKLQAKKAKKNT